MSRKSTSKAKSRDDNKLEALFNFQFVLIEMQQKLNEAMASGVAKEKLKGSMENLDRLIAIYKEYDKFYFDCEFHRHKTAKIELELQNANMAIIELKEERDKLLLSVNWK